MTSEKPNIPKKTSKISMTIKQKCKLTKPNRQCEHHRSKSLMCMCLMFRRKRTAERKESPTPLSSPNSQSSPLFMKFVVFFGPSVDCRFKKHLMTERTNLKIWMSGKYRESHESLAGETLTAMTIIYLRVRSIEKKTWKTPR